MWVIQFIAVYLQKYIFVSLKEGVKHLKMNSGSGFRLGTAGF